MTVGVPGPGSEPELPAAVAPPASSAASEPSGLFSDRVLVLLIGSVITTGLGILVGVVLARLLGPAGKGNYYFLSLLPTTVMIVVQLGLPPAFSYHAAREKVRGLNGKSVVLTIAMSAVGIVGFVAVYPLLTGTFVGDLPAGEIALAMASLPMALWATFTAAILVGRQWVGWYVGLNIAQSVASAILFISLVGILGLGVVGALVAFLIAVTIGSTSFFVGSTRATRIPSPGDVSYRELFRYGLPLYPGSLTEFFGVRVDVYLLAWLLPNPSAPLGLYSMAVTMSQLAYFVPNAVSTLFFPHVAGSERTDADRQVALVSRVTFLTTLVGAIVLIPVGTVFLTVVLPAFDDALPAFYLLLPAIVALSMARVLSSYVVGVGSTGTSSVVNIGAVALNVAMNLLLIPSYGIVGAAAASLISYSASALAFAVRASTLSRTRLADFWLVRWSDVRFTIDTGIGVCRRLLRLAPA
jgi:O-antigen/teichoic acid export membrane protein